VAGKMFGAGEAAFQHCSTGPATTLSRGQQTTERFYVKLPCPSVSTSCSKVRSDGAIVPTTANGKPLV
jgi:hypothetical protein